MKSTKNAFLPADILIPKAEYSKNWAVIACDQHTSEPEYWESVEAEKRGSKSALSLILPEIYLTKSDVGERIDGICRSMDEYLADGVFDEYKDAFIYVERIQSDGKLRQGIVGMIDLEQYDYSKGSDTPVRATEATVAERIPPRIKIRERASLELPHIMILIDDEDKTVIEPIGAKKNSLKPLYSADLGDAGTLGGWLVGEKEKEALDSALSELGNREAFEKKYGIKAAPLVYAMGDGNHSLATAKAYYEKLKAENPGKDLSRHPARYALAEIVNLHSDALRFEAIHRIITDANNKKLIEDMKKALSLSDKPSEQSFELVVGKDSKRYFIGTPDASMTVGSVQNFLDKYLAQNGGEIDYIHGTEALKKLVSEKNAVGIILPDISKSTLFPTVIKDGALVRKTFSMGHAADKRYYYEARKITEPGI